MDLLATDKYIYYTINMRQDTLDARESFGMNLRKIRENRGLSQSELGKLIGVTRQAISGLEAPGWPSHATVKKLAEALGCEETDLFRDPQEFSRSQANLEMAKKLLNKL
jgi:transcriptional regulator with XRE-family HTH domain